MERRYRRARSARWPGSRAQKLGMALGPLVVRYRASHGLIAHNRQVVDGRPLTKLILIQPSAECFVFLKPDFLPVSDSQSDGCQLT